MERKRKLPPRAAARIEQAAKRRTSTPPADGNTTRSATPTLSVAGGDGESQSQQSPQPQAQRAVLPRAIQAGKPLPTVEQAQPEDLSTLSFQSVQESGVLPESLARSRVKWINEGIFEKYWSKPSKRRGVAVDDPKNPPKESMVKLGQVLITVEPHMFEATMYGVKDPKPATALPANRPVLMYGPSRGSMPPPPASATPPPPKMKKRVSQSPAPVPPGLPKGAPLPQAPISNAAGAVPTPNVPPAQSAMQQNPTPRPALPPSPVPVAVLQPPPPPAKPILQPPVARAAPPQKPAMTPIVQPLQPGPAAPHSEPPMGTILRGFPPYGPVPFAPNPAPTLAAPLPNQWPPIVQPVNGPPINGPAPPMSPSVAAAGPPTGAPPGVPRPPAPAANGPGPSPTGTPRQAPVHPPGTDSIIVTLAERASSDPQLRDLMKRVANGHAPKDELDRFQAIINQITAEKQRNGATEGPSADRLLVDGRTVRFFAEEVRIILDIVLRSNPKQKSADLRPPVGSDPLVVLLVKTALDEEPVRDMVRRIGENRPQFSDATDLKAVLDRLKNQVMEEQESERQKSQPGRTAPLAPADAVPNSAPAAGPKRKQGPPGTGTAANAAAKANGVPNGALATASSPREGSASGTAEKNQKDHKVQPALRSKGPPPAPKLLDVSAVVFEFAGGTGDRYLFPKFSIVDYVPVPEGPPEVVASFLIVRKGSASEYGGDPDLDYYQPITIRLQVSPLSNSQKLLEYFGRVVAPADEVRRYMDNVMNSMTRAEYVLLAMRLPRNNLVAGAVATGDDSIGLDDNGDQTMSDDRMDVDKKLLAASSSNGDESYVVGHPQPLQGVLWTTTTTTSKAVASGREQRRPLNAVDDVDREAYDKFITSILPKAVEEEA